MMKAIRMISLGGYDDSYQNDKSWWYCVRVRNIVGVSWCFESSQPLGITLGLSFVVMVVTIGVINLDGNDDNRRNYQSLW